jgi:hypothetical protein
MGHIQEESGEEEMYENPFNFSKPARAKDFYNRNVGTEQAFGFIRKLQSFSIVGERRLGKTSLMEHILSEDVFRGHDIDSKKHVIIYLNMSDLVKITKETLIGTIVERIGKETKTEIESADIFEKFDVSLRKLALNGKNLIIALDEFETIESILDDHFSHWLRAIFQRPYYMLITASQKTVGGIEPSSMGSPLFNIFGNLFLGLFTREETENMVREMFKRGNEELDEAAISFLADLSGGNPYLIQLLGFHYYEERRTNKEVDGDKFEDKMLDHLEDQFRGYWRHLSDEEKNFLLKIEDQSDDRVGYVLERKGYLVKKEGKLRIFSPLFKRFVETENSSNDLQLEAKVEKRRKQEIAGIPKWIRIILSLFAAFIIGVISNLVAPHIQEWLNFYPGFIRVFSSDIYFLSLMFSVLALIIAFIALLKLCQENTS